MFSSLSDKEPCKRAQNGIIGGVGIIQCSFNSSFNEIAWSYTGESTDPLVRIDARARLPQSPGHRNNSYSLRIDGSLLILDAASRTGSKEYKVETIDNDGEHWSQTVVYQFMGMLFYCFLFMTTCTKHSNRNVFILREKRN